MTTTRIPLIDIGTEMYVDGEQVVWEIFLPYPLGQTEIVMDKTDLEQLIYMLSDQLEALHSPMYTGQEEESLPEGTDNYSVEIALQPDQGDDIADMLSGIDDFEDHGFGD